ncbi:MAG: DUF5106 domain-containing protein [Muribaculaceae bacterium]|nr:DUF5106 domain-containing protein [Muribaculaceae bacterium]MDE6295406.1 DUF5106 domain-containing protein [Muribaculaceae bacterium]
MAGQFCLSVPTVNAQIVVEPLFEYPAAPEEIENLDERSAWLVTNFWGAMDLSNDRSVDQNALNHAFTIYTTAMQFADRQSVLQSVNALLKNLKGKPTLTMQFVKAAEESLFGPRAGIWSDEVYLPFLKSVINEQNITPIRKERYQRQYKLLQNTQPGRKAPIYKYRLANGHYRDFKADAPYTLIEFGDPDCDDCTFAKLKLEMATDIQDKIEDKTIRMMFIVPDVAPDEEEEMLEVLGEYPANWTVGVGYGIDDLYDVRQMPCFYLINSKGEIIAKNMDVSTAVNVIREELSKPSSRKK